MMQKVDITTSKKDTNYLIDLENLEAIENVDLVLTLNCFINLRTYPVFNV